MDITKVLREKREEILAIAKSYGAYNVRIFGSTVRNEANENSDVDILVSFERGRTIIDLVSLNDELESLLGKKVQVVTDGGIPPYLKDTILSEAVAI